MTSLTDLITATVASGEDVAISGFAKFRRIDRPARMARNPATGEMVKVAAKRVAAHHAVEGVQGRGALRQEGGQEGTGQEEGGREEGARQEGRGQEGTRQEEGARQAPLVRLPAVITLDVPGPDARARSRLRSDVCYGPPN